MNSPKELFGEIQLASPFDKGGLRGILASLQQANPPLPPFVKGGNVPLLSCLAGVGFVENLQ